MLATSFGEGLKRSLNNALRADVNPRTRSHLAVHGQTLFIEFVEMIPVGPVGNQVRIGNQNSWRINMGFDNGNRFSGLHYKGFVFIEFLQSGDNRIEIFPGARGTANTAINNQFMGVFGDIWDGDCSSASASALRSSSFCR